jgi:lipid II:glycine glycyltransferase (peptidoglycan interpeptide bridge formation enzyme)
MIERWVAGGPVDETEWDAAVERARDGTIFQTIGWGEHRRRAGWTPVRWTLIDDGELVGVAQVLRRSGPLGTSIGWCPGGPVVALRDAAPDEIARRLSAFMTAQPSRMYVRFDSYLEEDRTVAGALARVAARPRRRVNTGVTTVLDLATPHDELLAAMKHKHRYNLRRALALPIRWRQGCADEAGALARLYQAMLAAKRLRARRPPDEAGISDVCRQLGPRAQVLVGELDGRDVVGCLVLLLGDRAFLHMPVTGTDRSAGLSYAMIDVLVRDLRSSGARALDLAGIDPDGATPGVDRFKLGFGGRVVRRLGEWERSDPAILRLAVEAALIVRGRAIG